MIQHAMAALRRGFHIFPVQERGKRPHHAAGDWGETATNNPNQVIAWWSQYPQANIGVACKPSDLLVIDCDIAKTDWNLKGTEWAYVHEAYGPQVDGTDLLDEIKFKHDGDMDDFETYSVWTGSGGCHFYYRWYPGWPKGSQASIVKGVIDVRNGGGRDGGYVLGEGSVTLDETQRDGTVKKGGPYVANELTRVIADPPSWIRRLVVEKPSAPRQPSVAGIRQPGVISFSGLAQTVAQARPGNRNNALLFSARAMCSDQAPEAQCLEILGEAARAAGLDEQEIRQTISSAYRLQRQKEGR